MDADAYGNMINFYKDVCIMGRYLLLFVTGAGKYSIDAKLGLTAEAAPTLNDHRSTSP